MCVLDRGAVDAVFDAVGDRLDGATIVNLTSSSPEDARALAARSAGSGARYLDGKIMVPTPLVGTVDGLVLYSGDRIAFAQHADTLHALGGDADLLGEDPGLAAIVEASEARGLDTSVPGMPRSLVRAAIVKGHGRDGFSRVIDVLRRPTAAVES